MSNQHQITACPKTTQNRTKQEGGGVVVHDHQIYENLTPFLYSYFVYSFQVIIKPAQATEKPQNSPVLLQICQYDTFDSINMQLSRNPQAGYTTLVLL